MRHDLDIHAFEILSEGKKVSNLNFRLNKLEVCELPKRMQELETEVEILKTK